MSKLSEVHDDLTTIHAILLGQRQVAMINAQTGKHGSMAQWEHRMEVIDDLLLEFEAGGIVWPGNVVEVEFSRENGPLGVTVTSPSILGTYCTRCANGNRVEVCGCGGDNVVSLNQWDDLDSYGV